MVEPTLLNKAIEALLKHHKENDNSNSLLGNELPVHVQFTLDRIPEATSSKPTRVEIPHPLHKVLNEGESEEGLEEVEVCLIVKDEAKERVKEIIEKFPEYMSTIKKVLTLTSLRKKFSQYKDRRELLKRYDIFLADDRILPMLGKALGKNFFQEKKQPVPIKLTRQEALPYAVKKCLRSTFLWISPGTCVSVKAGNTAMPLEHLVKNVEAILENGVRHIPRKWSNVAAINIKTSQSVALPVYNKTKEELMEIEKMAKVNTSEGSDKMKRDREEDDVEVDSVVTETKKKKRKKELAAKSPLVKALKKQNKAKNEADDSATRSQESKKERSSSMEKNDPKTPKSNKKKKAKVTEHEDKVDKPKSAKKKKTSGEESVSKDFVRSKKNLRVQRKATSSVWETKASDTISM
eukprot:CAMPEP_0204613984 /NCGR_PEP_ID=MMETSP0717-20131115/1855_1 /ASSEMBLY_ACC=CAM_ASM_000666 /TAXON_ID=230516 /ORGANISM="Chaetoceros curvisetus" /LENGTH=406 /DNA_ID=CAMNT_0051626567 /DNA_START=64 /DNA_END=1284 /DNA_ORIENTATION=+